MSPRRRRLAAIACLAAFFSCSPGGERPVARRVPAWAEPAKGTAFDPESGLPFEVVDKATGIALALIPAGEVMLLTCEERYDYDGGAPSQRVAIRAFYMGKVEVAVGEFETMTGIRRDNPDAPGKDRWPVVNVSWYDADKAARKCGFRLPTEAEWVYAYQAGDSSKRYYGPLSEIAWWEGNSGNRTHEVGTLRPNRYGLYDMLGNVEEWGADITDDLPVDERSQLYPRVVKGGAYRYGQWFLDPHHGGGSMESVANTDRGFRVARDP